MVLGTYLLIRDLTLLQRMLLDRPSENFPFCLARAAIFVSTCRHGGKKCPGRLYNACLKYTKGSSTHIMRTLDFYIGNYSYGLGQVLIIHVLGPSRIGQAPKSLEGLRSPTTPHEHS